MTESEERPLLSVNGSQGSTQSLRGTFHISYRAAAAIGLGFLALASLATRHSRSNEVQFNELVAEYNKGGEMENRHVDVGMFKRTHLSIDAIKGGVWLQTHMGFGAMETEYWFNSTGATDPLEVDGDGRKAENNRIDSMKGHDHNSVHVLCSQSLQCNFSFVRVCNL